MAKSSKGLTLEWKEIGKCPVVLTDNIFAEENNVLADTLRSITSVESPRILIVADYHLVEKTENIGTLIGKYVKAHNLTLAGAPIVIKSSEKIKNDNMQSFQKLMAASINAQIGLNDVLLVMGGGSLLDLANFTAAHIRGGVKVVRIPTTTAAMFDGAFAMEAALDLAKIKDGIRVDAKPSAILIDPAFAKTILDGVWRGGFSELVRYAAIHDGALLRKVSKIAEKLYSNEKDIALLKEVIEAFLESRVKKGGTTFGLWVAGRLESLHGYHLPHGYAIPIGVMIDLHYARLRGLCDEKTESLIIQTLKDLGTLESFENYRQSLLNMNDILLGLETWRLAKGSEAIELPAGIGKGVVDETPDRSIIEVALKEIAQSE